MKMAKCFDPDGFQLLFPIWKKIDNYWLETSKRDDT
jgi:hypothetical protein